MLAKIGTWLLTALLSFAFLGAGSMKVMANPQMVENFTKWGFPAWFLTFTGALEIVAALLLLWPRSAAYAAALLLAPTMFFGALTHVVKDGKPGEAVPAVVLLLLSLALAYLRRHQAWRPQP